jgi:hypothetical protein
MVEPLFEHLSDEQRSFVKFLLGHHQTTFGEADVQPLSHDCFFVTHLKEEEKAFVHRKLEQVSTYL